MRVIDVCAGIGGLSLGLERAGMATVAHIEIDNHCRQVLKKHWPGVPRWKDVKDARGADLPAADVVAGGTPCQDWSVAGRRAGIGGGRSGLFFEYARVVEEVAPAWCVWENVPGVLSQHDGSDFRTVLGVLADLGYHCAWRVLDAQYFGVAQRRRRVFVVGRAGSWTGGAQVLLDPQSGGGDPPARRGQVSGVAPGPGRGIAGSGEVVQGLTGSFANGGADDNKAQAGWLVPEVSPALCSQRGQRYDHNEQAFVPMAYGVAENQRAEVLMTEEYLRQLTAGGGKPGQGYPAVMTPELAVRRLLPVECLRLQGLPDDWLDGLGLADSAKYRLVGNAVCVPVARWIGRRIMTGAGEVAA